MNEIQGHVEGSTQAHTEGNPEVERLEQQMLGKHYEQAEVVHRFSDDHAWFHPALIIVVLAIIGGSVWFVWKAKKYKIR